MSEPTLNSKVKRYQIPLPHDAKEARPFPKRLTEHEDSRGCSRAKRLRERTKKIYRTEEHIRAGIVVLCPNCVRRALRANVESAFNSPVRYIFEQRKRPHTILSCLGVWTSDRSTFASLSFFGTLAISDIAALTSSDLRLELDAFYLWARSAVTRPARARYRLDRHTGRRASSRCICPPVPLSRLHLCLYLPLYQLAGAACSPRGSPPSCRSSLPTLRQLADEGFVYGHPIAIKRSLLHSVASPK